MPIPDNIEREHIFQAIIKTNREGIPPRRGPREWAVNYEGEVHPCKLIISLANFYVNHEELDPNTFITYEAQEYLMGKGFTIIPYNP